MKKLNLDAESLVVMTFEIDTPSRDADVAAVGSAEMTACTCRPYLCINWPW